MVINWSIGSIRETLRTPRNGGSPNNGEDTGNKPIRFPGPLKALKPGFTRRVNFARNLEARIGPLHSLKNFQEKRGFWEALDTPGGEKLMGLTFFAPTISPQDDRGDNRLTSLCEIENPPRSSRLKKFPRLGTSQGHTGNSLFRAGGANPLLRRVDFSPLRDFKLGFFTGNIARIFKRTPYWNHSVNNFPYPCEKFSSREK